MKQQIKINTPNGVGVIEDISVSELGFLMLKVYFENEVEKRWVSYNLGIHDVNDNMFTKELFNTMGN